MIISRIRFLYALILPVAIIFMNFGQPIFGSDKLALSNVYQVVVILCLLFFVKQSLHGLILLSLFFIISLLSILYVSYAFKFEGKPFVILFMLVSIYYLVTSYSFLKGYVLKIFSAPCEFYSSFSPVIVISFLIYVAFLAFQLFSDSDRVTFGMDDKSHASIILCFLSFLSCKAFKKYWLPFSFLFFFLTLFSLSRLSFVFLPFIFLYVLYRIISSNSVALKVTSFLFFQLFLSSILYLYNMYPGLFSVLDRVSSMEAVADNDSTNAHSLLIYKGIELKLSNVGNFVFGISPGSFGDILVNPHSDVDYTELKNTDPNFINEAKKGKAPIHSTHLAFFVEYPIIIFVFYLFYNFYVAYRLVVHKLYFEVLFYIPFMISVLLYSSHNKFYYFVVYLFIECSILVNSKLGDKNFKLTNKLSLI